ncbi:MAG: cell division protein FtsX [Elusimicrobiota bacterium]
MKKLALLLSFLLGLSAGLMGETLILLRTQCSSVETSLRTDFVLLLTPKKDISDAEAKVAIEKILALPDVSGARYVSKDDELARLRNEDPSLVDSIAWLGQNPLRSAFEVSLDPRGFGRLSDAIESLSAIENWADVRYKRGQVKAILQAQFYGYWIDLVLGFVAAFVIIMTLCVVWISPHHLGRRLHSFAPALVSAAGAICGAMMALATAAPLRLIAPWWSWPSLASQSGLILILAAAGWSLCAEPA